MLNNLKKFSDIVDKITLIIASIMTSMILFISIFSFGYYSQQLNFYQFDKDFHMYFFKKYDNSYLEKNIKKI